MASFLKCGIMNNLDGTEDDLVYDSTENTGEVDDYNNNNNNNNNIYPGNPLALAVFSEALQIIIYKNKN